MKRKTITTGIMSLAFCSVAMANTDLEVVFDGCQPVQVNSNDDSCGTGSDPVNVACRPDNGPVRWVPVSSIAAISTKPGSPGALHNCEAKPNQGYYQCIVRGNVGEEISYNVTSTEGCILDPVIRIRD